MHIYFMAYLRFHFLLINGYVFVAGYVSDILFLEILTQLLDGVNNINPYRA